MKFRPHDFCPCILTVALAIIVLSGASYAQFTVTLSPTPNPTPLPSVMSAPTGSFSLRATASNVPTGGLQKIVFYRNDVPHKVFNSSTLTQDITENELGQDSYTYRARAYAVNGEFVDSTEININVETPRVFRMGDPAPYPLPQGTPYATPTPAPTPTSGPDRYEDHTDDIKAWLAYIGSLPTGGTLYLPCKSETFIDAPSPNPDYYDTAIYNISDTIVVPKNVTIQSESSEDPGQCQIRWFDLSYTYPTPTPYPSPVPNPSPTPQRCFPAPTSLRDKPMFLVAGGTSRVRFRDMSIRSTSAGPDCYPRGAPREDWEDIANEGSVAFALYGFTGTVKDVKDVIFENVSITNFSYGIKASTCVPNENDDGCTDSGAEISDIKIRGYRPTHNNRNLYIDSLEAYNWDVQNINNTGMAEGQGSVEIINAGIPSGYTGPNGWLKFLQVNCNGDRDPAPLFCMRVEKHGGLYIKQLHHEGTDYAIEVVDISDRGTNPDPIVFEGSVLTGKFYDESMGLYTIGNSGFAEPEINAPNLDEGRLRFYDEGLGSTVIDCGDIGYDLTDTHFAEPSPTPTPGTVTWDDLRMIGTHSERNRSIFYIPKEGQQRLDMPHTNCPATIKDVGGEHFNTGVMPVTVTNPYVAPNQTPYPHLPYSNVMNQAACAPGLCNPRVYLQNLLDRLGPRGAVYIEDSFTFDGTVFVPSGAMIIGNPESVLYFDVTRDFPTNMNMFQIDIPMGTDAIPRTAGVVMKNLNLYTEEEETTGIAIYGANGADASPSSDNHFSGLQIEGFTRGVFAGVHSMSYAHGHPMMDGYSWKNLKLINNVTGFEVDSSNTSNWNVMNVEVESDRDESRGWDQKGGGNSIQNISCQGDDGEPMVDCVRLEITTSYLTGLKRTTDVTNALTIKESGQVGGVAPYIAYQASNVILRNSDLRTEGEASGYDNTAQLNILGRAFVVSMNNKYDWFNFSSTHDANRSRVTSCGDTPDDEALFSGIAASFANKWVGHDTPTVITCGSNPVTFDDTVRWGGEADDKPMAGSLYSSNADDHVFFRPGTTQAKFYIREKNGTRSRIVDWGLPTDVPLIGRFYASTEKEQLVAWRNGTWYVNLPDLDEPINPANDVTAGWSFGQAGDKPFVGNFYPEEGDADDQRDEIGVFRPDEKDNVFYVMNPRNEVWSDLSTGEDNFGYDFQVGDFLGRGYDQLAQYVAATGEWHIFDFYLEDATVKTMSDPETEDVAVAGKYFSGTCSQLAVWRPSTETFIVEDAASTSCGGRDGSLLWGLKRTSSDTDNDIPLVMRGVDGLDRPTAYQKDDDPVFTYNMTKGLWWVHDPVVPNP
jgi:hypothetical protein